MVIRRFAIQRQSSPMNAKTKHGHQHIFCYPVTIKSDGTRRQYMVICTIFAIQRQSSLMVRADETWSSAPFLVSSDNQVKWHAETKHGCHTLISSGDLCLITCDHSLVLVRCLASIIRQFVKFQDMPKNQKKY